MPSAKTTKPKIVLLGPTNVGKSALFNRLTRSREAIVCDRPGVTVDRHEKDIQDLILGFLTIVDTGGVGPEARSHPLGAEIERAAKQAVEEASLILFVVDGTRDVGTEELEIASWLRHQKIPDQTPTLVVVNKSDAKRHDPNPYYSLGFDSLVSVSAEHDIGILDLWDQIAVLLKLENPAGSAKDLTEVAPKEEAPRILVLGRPNVGKSTLLNYLLGTERHVVSDLPGTTRDTIESEWKKAKGAYWILCDTAGIRQPGRLDRGVEWVAREKLKESARKADLAILLIDASLGITDLDASIAGMAIDFGLSLVIAFNKWDKMKGDKAEDQWNYLKRTQDLKLDFIEWCPTVQVSALTGRGVPDLIKQVEKVMAVRKHRVQTSKLNKLFDSKLKYHHHPLGPGARPSKFYYMSQISVSPPEFIMFANIPGSAVHYSYRRFVSNALRKEFGLIGTPIRIHFKQAHKNLADATSP